MKLFIFNFNIQQGLKRFWPAILFALIASLLINILIAEEAERYFIFNGAVVSYIGMLLCINVQLFKERYQLSNLKYYGLLSLALLIVIGLYILLPEDEQLLNRPTVYRILGLVLILHLLVSVVPFFNKGSLESFWQYNRNLLLLFFEAAFNAAALFLGLVMALLALDFLFNVDIDEKIYLHTFFTIASLFNTIYFLSRFPAAYYDAQISKPHKGYEIFSQYILIPLNVIYILILYAYGVKILMEMSLPKGWVSNLVLWFSVLGILAFLLNYFNHRFFDQRLAKAFRKYFFYIIVPPILLLFLAIFTRINQYGITENRFIVASLGIWLFGVAVYFIISKKDNIKVIPISLIGIILISILGPWDMGNASKRNQQKRLLGLFSEHGLLVNGRLISTKDTLSDQVSTELTQIIKFLDERDGLQFLNNYDLILDADDQMQTRKAQFKQDGDDYNFDYQNSKLLSELMGFEYSDRFYLNESNTYFSYYLSTNHRQYDTTGSDYAFLFVANQKKDLNSRKNDFYLLEDKPILVVNLDSTVVHEIPLGSLTETLEAKGLDRTISDPEMMKLEFEIDKFKAVIYLNSLSGYIENNIEYIENVDGIIFYKLK